MHCADEGFEKPLPHLFEAAVFLMGFTLWGKLEFNKRDGFLDCPLKRRTKNAKAFHDKCENFSFRASNETAVLITAFYSLHGDHLGYG